MKEPVISISNLSKVYKLYKEPVDRLKESLHPFGKKYHQDFFALKNLSLDIFEGEIVGVVGANGAGKSTLLKILAGVLTPTTGDVQLNGRVSALLELGMGFNPELSGRENIIFNATILGLSPQSIEAKLDEIISFADIGAYIDQPLKSYSSGMVARLAFAVAVNIDAEILIIDEALSVGDVRFQQKALRKLQELMGRAKAIVFVSHSMDSVRKFCTRAIWVKDGIVYKDGDTKSIVTDYYAYMTTGNNIVESLIREPLDRVEKKQNNWVDVRAFKSVGDGGAKITQALLSKEDSTDSIGTLNGGEKLCLSIEIDVFEEVDFPTIGFTINNSLGINVFGVSSSHFNTDIPGLVAGERLLTKISFELPFLLNGNYTMSIGVAATNGHGDKTKKDQVYDALVFQIQSSDLKQRHGSLIIPQEARFQFISLS